LESSELLSSSTFQEDSLYKKLGVLFGDANILNTVDVELAQLVDGEDAKNTAADLEMLGVSSAGLATADASGNEVDGELITFVDGLGSTKEELDAFADYFLANQQDEETYQPAFFWTSAMDGEYDANMLTDTSNTYGL
jgi:hypothetical protein